MALMKAAIFADKNQNVLGDKPIPEIGARDALPRTDTTDNLWHPFVPPARYIRRRSGRLLHRHRAVSRRQRAAASAAAWTFPPVTHRFRLDSIEATHEFFRQPARRRDESGDHPVGFAPTAGRDAIALRMRKRVFAHACSGGSDERLRREKHRTELLVGPHGSMAGKLQYSQ